MDNLEKTLPNISAIVARSLGGSRDSVDATELDLTKLPDAILRMGGRFAQVGVGIRS